MERASSRAAWAAAASSALDLGRDLASACAGGQLLGLISSSRGLVGVGAYLALFAYSALSIGFLLG